jgi:uncharacterized integral membrane protein
VIYKAAVHKFSHSSSALAVFVPVLLLFHTVCVLPNGIEHKFLHSSTVQLLLLLLLFHIVWLAGI